MDFGLMTRFTGIFDKAPDQTLQLTITHTHTCMHAWMLSLSLLFTVTSSLSLLGSHFQQWTFPFIWVSELAPATATSFYQQQLTTAEPQQFFN
jgi:hypothetical protein